MIYYFYSALLTTVLLLLTTEYSSTALLHFFRCPHNIKHSVWEIYYIMFGTLLYIVRQTNTRQTDYQADRLTDRQIARQGRLPDRQTVRYEDC